VDSSAVTTDPIQTVTVLGFPVHRIDLEQAARLLWEAIRSQPQVRIRVATLNPEMVMAGLDNLELGAALRSAELVVPDGSGIVWALRRAGLRQQQRVTGVDLVETLLLRCAAQGLRLFLLGGQPGVAEAAAANLRCRYPGVDLVGVAHGYFSPDENGKMVAMINRTRPDLLLVGMGVPRQEIWLQRQWGSLTVSVGIGVGGLLDLWAGRTKRAPAFFQTVGLEWAYRVWREPTRWRRLRVLPTFVRRVWAENGAKKQVSEGETRW
jgi:N-acetylglucosaminyldiphosphoundecaprenol N-acetyl-beta-D-mannosaminyltransferase